MTLHNPHWGYLTVGAPLATPVPIRHIINVELAESRAFTRELFRDYTRSGHRSIAGQLVDALGSFGWVRSDEGHAGA